MDDMQVGAVIRAVRRRLGLSQAELASRAGVSQGTVSNLERGRIEHVSLPVARRVCLTLEISLPLAPRWRGADLYRLLDAKHADLVNALIARLAAVGWKCEPEWTFNWFGERGSVDVLARHLEARALVLSEVKSKIVDIQETLATLNRKARAVQKALLEDQGWRGDSTAVLLVVPDSSALRHAITRHAAVFDAALPARTVEVRRWLNQPAGDLRGILFLPAISDRSGLGKRGPSPRGK